jgi:hypothetical protein
VLLLVSGPHRIAAFVAIRRHTEPAVGLDKKVFRRVSYWLDQVHADMWLASDMCRTTKRYLTALARAVLRHFPSLGKEDHRVLTRLITGHFAFNLHLSRMGLYETMCPVY